MAITYRKQPLIFDICILKIHTGATRGFTLSVPHAPPSPTHCLPVVDWNESFPHSQTDISRHFLYCKYTYLCPPIGNQHINGEDLLSCCDTFVKQQHGFPRKLATHPEQEDSKIPRLNRQRYGFSLRKRTHSFDLSENWPDYMCLTAHEMLPVGQQR